MKYKFTLLSLFVVANIVNASAYVDDRHGSIGNGGGGMDISSMRSVEVSPVTQVKILNIKGQEIARIAIDDLDYYLQSLQPGKYILVYIDSEGQSVYQLFY